MAAATVSAKTSREADADGRDLTVAKRSDSFVYGDDFYACAPTCPAFVTSASLDDLQHLRQPGRPAAGVGGVPAP